MEKQDKFEQLIKDRLDQLSHDVPTDIWNGIESGLSNQAGISPLAKLGGTFKFILAAGAIAISSMAILLSANREKKVTLTKPTVSTSKEKVIQLKETENTKIRLNAIGDKAEQTQTTKPFEKQKFVDQKENVKFEKPVAQPAQELSYENPVAPTTVIGENSEQPKTAPVFDQHPSETSSQVTSNPPQNKSDEVQDKSDHILNQQSDETSTSSELLVEDKITGEIIVEKELLDETTEEKGDIFVNQNVITPNGDHFNDVLKVEYKHMRKIEFTVLNINGNVIFHTNNPEEYWDGLDRGGNRVVAGVYYYVVTGIDLLGNQVNPIRNSITVKY